MAARVNGDNRLIRGEENQSLQHGEGVNSDEITHAVERCKEGVRTTFRMMASGRAMYENLSSLGAKWQNLSTSPGNRIQEFEPTLPHRSALQHQTDNGPLIDHLVEYSGCNFNALLGIWAM